MTAIRRPFSQFAAAAGIAIVIGLLAPVSAGEALGAGAQRAARAAKPGWRAVPAYARRCEPPFVLILGVSY
jgi:hypothetical protein